MCAQMYLGGVYMPRSTRRRQHGVFLRKESRGGGGGGATKNFLRASAHTRIVAKGWPSSECLECRADFELERHRLFRCDGVRRDSETLVLTRFDDGQETWVAHAELFPELLGTWAFQVGKVS